MQPNQNTGSFGIGLGGIQALKEATKRRGIDIPQLESMSAAAPGIQVAPSAVPTTNPQIGNVEQNVATQALGAPTTPGTPPARSWEAQISISALKGVAESERKIAESLAGLR